jgi:type VI secretion system protein ImpI
MPLVLTILNADQLPDGGPPSITVRGQRGIDIGRDPFLDWTLPDPERVVSTRHAEIRFRDGGYWLTDISTNGTFLNASPHRMSGPHRLRHGDRLEIGAYVIGVTLDEEAPAAPPAPAPGPARGGDVWAGGESAPPLPASALRAPPPAASQPDMMDWFVDVAPVEAPSPPRRPGVPAARQPDGDWRLPPATDPFSSQFQPRAVPREEPARRPPAPPAGAPPGEQPPSPAFGIVAAEPLAFEPARVQPEAQPAPPPAPPAVPAFGDIPFGSGPAVAPPPARPAPAVDLDLAALVAQGAGVRPDVFAGRPAEELAVLLGVLLRLSAESVQQMLKARADTKGLVRSTNQTMIQAFENNPLKFSPSVEDAIRIMFDPTTRSYLDARRTFEQSFADLKQHHLNSYIAMQQALKMVVEDLDPDVLDAGTDQEKGLSGMLTSRKSRLWELYVTRWKAKTARHDNGMVDTFMLYFAECYDRLGQKLRS